MVKLVLIVALSLGCFPPLLHNTFMVSELDSGWIASPSWDQTHAVIALIKNGNKKEILVRWKERSSDNA